MPLRIIECEQGSPEWLAARCGNATASRVADITAKTKSGYSTSRANYAAEIVVERLTRRVADRYVNDEMRWGSEKEPEARDLYAFMRNAEGQKVGFVLHPTIKNAGASPDWLVGADGLAEFKCPNTATHIETVLSEKIPEKYIKQMQWQMDCCDRAWCDFVSFDPRVPAPMQLFILRVPRDNNMIFELRREVVSFLAEVDQKIAKLQARFNFSEAA